MQGGASATLLVRACVPELPSKKTLEPPENGGDGEQLVNLWMKSRPPGGIENYAVRDERLQQVRIPRSNDLGLFFPRDTASLELLGEGARLYRDGRVYLPSRPVLL